MMDEGRSGHDHDHGEDHGHGNSSFDERAATWDDEAKIERSRRVADAIVAATAPDPTTRLLEYGAGTALVTEALGERVGPVLLADTSAGMREVMESKIAEGRLRDARVVDLDLGADEVEIPEEQFDLIVTVLTMHHVMDLDRVLARFADLLAGDGRLCIVDLDAEDGSFHGEGFTGHHGFDRDALAEQLRAVGFDEVEMSDCGRLDRPDGSYSMFLAVAGGSGRNQVAGAVP